MPEFRRSPESFQKSFGVIELDITEQEDPHRVVLTLGTDSTRVSLAMEDYEAIQLAEALMARARVRTQ